MRNTFWISFIIALFVSAVIVSNFDENQMMSTILQSGLITETAEISESEFQEAFMDFIATNQKSYYNSWEFDNRYQTFKSNYQQISDHNLNSDMIGFTLKINQFGDLSQEEFKAKYLTLQTKQTQSRFGFEDDDFCDKQEETFGRHGHKSRKAFRDVPESVDWRTEGAVNSVKNQGSCGSCWAFSAIAAIESAAFIETGTLPELSEQQLVDCSTSYGNEGCNGGLMDWAFEYAHDHALCSETDYPYKGKDGTCQNDDDSLCSEGYQVNSCVDVTIGSKAKLQEAVAQHPVSIGVCAEGLAWQFYFGGIVRWLCGQCQDHGVAVVGYGHGGWKTIGDVDYWIVRNSWGSGWGEKGYIRVEADDSAKGTCGILESPSFPLLTKQ
jgi:C1A family cysteine protease